jgi:hypothetical protein
VYKPTEKIPEETQKQNPRKAPRAKPRNPNPSITNRKGAAVNGQLTWFSLRRPPSACAGRRRADQIPRGLAPRADRGRASTPQGRSPRHRSGHHGEAPRRPRAHLAVDARAGEGARRGAARLPPVAVLSLSLGVEKKQASGEREEVS